MIFAQCRSFEIGGWDPQIWRFSREGFSLSHSAMNHASRVETESFENAARSAMHSPLHDTQRYSISYLELIMPLRCHPCKRSPDAVMGLAAEAHTLFSAFLFPSLPSLLFTPRVTPENRLKQPLQMLLETNQTNANPFQFENQMRAPIQPKLYRNYRSHIRADAERRRGAP